MSTEADRERNVARKAAPIIARAVMARRERLAAQKATEADSEQEVAS